MYISANTKKEVMTILELKMKELELIREIADDETLLESALNYVKKLKKNRKKTPCQFTVSEKENILLKGEQDVAKEKGTLHEDFEKEFASW